MSKIKNGSTTDRYQARTCLFITVMDRIFEAIPHIAARHKLNMRIQKNSVEGIIKSFNAILYATTHFSAETLKRKTRPYYGQLKRYQKHSD